MSTKDIFISLKFNNYNYAPGIATYGIDGKTGKTGLDGNNIYFTNCIIISDNNELKDLAELIRKNVLPTKGSTEKISRPYKNGDLFFDINGIIFKLIDIDALLGSLEIGSYVNYFSIAGKINVEDSNIFAKNGIENINGRLIFNSSNYSGYDVIKGVSPEESTPYINTDAAVNIISNVVDKNDNIEMVNMQSIDDVDIEDGKLSVYYKTTDNAYYLDSNKPIVINGDLKLNNDNNVTNEYDNYSTVLTSEDTITYFKYICDLLKYNILYDSSTEKYNLVIYQNDEGRDLVDYLIKRNDTVYAKVYDNENNLILLKLNDIIYGAADSSNYYDHENFIDNIDNIIIPVSDVLLNIYILYPYSVGLYTDYPMHYTIEKNLVLNNFTVTTIFDLVELLNASTLSFENFLINKYNNINDVYYKYLYNRDTNKIYLQEVDLYLQLNHIDSYYVTDQLKLYKYTFNTIDIKSNEDNQKFIKFLIYPNILDKNNNLTYDKPYININVSNLEDGIYTIYFTIYGLGDTSSNKIKIIILNILISDKLDLLLKKDISQYSIVIPLPDSISAISRVSLLHNTEIFLKQ